MQKKMEYPAEPESQVGVDGGLGNEGGGNLFEAVIDAPVRLELQTCLGELVVPVNGVGMIKVDGNDGQPIDEPVPHIVIGIGKLGFVGRSLSCATGFFGSHKE